MEYLLQLRRYEHTVDKATLIKKLLKSEKDAKGLLKSKENIDVSNTGEQPENELADVKSEAAKVAEETTEEFLMLLGEIGMDSAKVLDFAIQHPDALMTDELHHRTQDLLEEYLFYQVTADHIQHLVECYEETLSEHVVIPDDPFTLVRKTESDRMQAKSNFGPDLAKILAPAFVNNTNIKSLTLEGSRINMELLRGARCIDLTHDYLQQEQKRVFEEQQIAAEPIELQWEEQKPYTTIHAIIIAEALRTFGSNVVRLDIRGHKIGEEGMAALAEAVPSLTSLSELNGLKCPGPINPIKLRDFQLTLHWEEIKGPELAPQPPKDRREIRCKKLAAELRKRTSFCQSEWDDFAIDDLSENCYIVVDGKHFKPVFDQGREVRAMM